MISSADLATRARNLGVPAEKVCRECLWPKTESGECVSAAERAFKAAQWHGPVADIWRSRVGPLDFSGCGGTFVGMKANRRNALPVRELKCPKCGRVTHTTSTGDLKCGDCLMERVEIVALVEVTK